MLDPNAAPSPEHRKSEDDEGTKPRKKRESSGRPSQTTLAGDYGGPRAELQRDKSYDLFQPTEADWSDQPPDILDRNYTQVEIDYFDIVNDYLEQANLAAERYKSFSQSHTRWRLRMIWLTGILAIVNTVAALKVVKYLPGDPEIWSTTLSAAAAFYAVVITLAANIENVQNREEKATGFRESRDLLLNRYREYYFKWFYYVEAYGKTPKACMNAARLYHQLVDSDQELRQKLKQLTEVHPRRGAEAGPRNVAAGASPH